MRDPTNDTAFGRVVVGSVTLVTRSDEHLDDSLELTTTTRPFGRIGGPPGLEVRGSGAVAGTQAFRTSLNRTSERSDGFLLLFGRILIDWNWIVLNHSTFRSNRRASLRGWSFGVRVPLQAPYI